MHCSTSCSTLRRTSSDAFRRVSRGISDNVLPWEAAREAPWVMRSRPQQWLLCTHYQPLKIAVSCEGKISIKVRSRPDILVKCTWQTTHSGGWHEKWSFPFSCHYNHYHCFDYFALTILLSLQTLQWWFDHFGTKKDVNIGTHFSSFHPLSIYFIHSFIVLGHDVIERNNTQVLSSRNTEGPATQVLKREEET